MASYATYNPNTTDLVSVTSDGHYGAVPRWAVWDMSTGEMIGIDYSSAGEDVDGAYPGIDIDMTAILIGA